MTCCWTSPTENSAVPHWLAIYELSIAERGPFSGGSPNQGHHNLSEDEHQQKRGASPVSIQKNTDNDSTLLLRFLVILVLAHEGAKVHGHPRPAASLNTLKSQHSALHPGAQVFGPLGLASGPIPISQPGLHPL